MSGDTVVDPRLTAPSADDFIDSYLTGRPPIVSDLIATWVPGNNPVAYRLANDTVTQVTPADLGDDLTEDVINQLTRAVEFAHIVGDKPKPDPEVYEDCDATARAAAALAAAGLLPSPTTSRGRARDNSTLITARYWTI